MSCEYKRFTCITFLFVACLFCRAIAAPAHADEGAADFFEPRILSRIFPAADGFGPLQGNPPAIAVYRGDKQLGYVFSSRQVVGSTGFSGKPLDIVIGLDLEGKIAGLELREHHEPILVIGIRDADLERHMQQYVGFHVATRVTPVADKRKETAPETVLETATEEAAVDILSGASITTAVVNDVIMRASRAMARSRGILPPLEDDGRGVVDYDRFESKDWSALLREGAIAVLRLYNSDVSQAFAAQGVPAKSIKRMKQQLGEPKGRFIDLYAALATPALIGRNLLGDHLFGRLSSDLEPGAQMILIAGDGRYSFKGTAYVKNIVFDRIQIIQGENTFKFNTGDHRRVESLAVEGAPILRELGLFTLSPGSGFDPAQPWRLEILVVRSYTDAKGKEIEDYAAFTLPYRLPGELIERAAGVEDVAAERASWPLWQHAWADNQGKIVVLSVALLILLSALVFQDSMERRPRFYRFFRLGFLVFTTVWIGWYAGAQLSVINVITFLQSLVTAFSWEFYLLGPLIFILWCFVAVALLFWGRGVYCGWLCPFGALQELLNEVAQKVRVPQINIPFTVQERLWPIKYMLFLGLLGLSFYSMRESVVLSEVEPFKTVFSLNFQRAWPFVAYAVGLLVAGLFIERFFCRYLCPLGAALAVPARVRMFEWLKRRPQCGRECRICAQECTVGAIHPNGQINPNECIYCMHCQVLYYDDHRCPPMISRRERKETYRAAREGENGDDPAREGGHVDAV